METILLIGGKTLQQMRQLYFKIKNEVFGGNIAGTFMKMPQKSKKFEQILKKEFGEDMLMSSVTHPRYVILSKWIRTSLLWDTIGTDQSV